MVKVSVIVPIYNVEKYLNRCLDSLVNQTLKDIEIILVNDGSTDGSKDIAKTYEKEYQNVKLYNKKNGGLSDARNYGLKYATGKYVAFIDSDDYADITLYEKMYKKAEEEKLDYVECDFIWEYPKKSKIDTGIRYTNIKEMMTYARVIAWNKLIKRKLIKEEFPLGLHYEDIEFFYKLIPEIKSFGFVEEPLIHYVQRKNSIIKIQDRGTLDALTVLDNVIDYYKNKKIYDEYKEELEYTYSRIVLCSSLKRMAKIKDGSLRKECLDEVWKDLNTRFPKWRENKILNDMKKSKFKTKNLYMKTINKATFKIYGKVL